MKVYKIKAELEGLVYWYSAYRHKLDLNEDEAQIFIDKKSAEFMVKQTRLEETVAYETEVRLGSYGANENTEVLELWKMAKIVEYDLTPTGVEYDV